MRKVGDRLSKCDIVDEVFGAIGEIAKKSDFISVGLKDQDIYALCKQGYLEIPIRWKRPLPKSWTQFSA